MRRVSVTKNERDKEQQHELPAVFTVEASLLMPLILGMLILVLVAGFYLHDRACMQGAACETAVMGSNLQTYDQQSSDIAKMGRTLLRSRLMWSRDVTGSASAGPGAAQAEFTGSFTVPGIVGQLWKRSGSEKVRGSWSVTIYEPAKIIRRIRGAAYLTEVINGSHLQKKSKS